MEPWSPLWKAAKYEETRAAWADCSRCPLSECRNKLVMGEGNLDAKVMFIGEAPGEAEDAAGRPFVGKSGELLDGMLEFTQLDRQDVFIDNIVACRPPKNRDPTTTEKSACLNRLYETIYLVDPWLIVAVGKQALTTLAGGRAWGIEQEHGKLFSTPSPEMRVTGEKNGAEIPGKLFPRKGQGKYTYTLDYDIVGVFHPSYILRMDSPDDNGEYPHGGPADHTIKDLKEIIRRIEQLSEEYEKHGRNIERIR